MTYEEAIHWLYTQLPMYQRIGAAAYKEDLTNTIKLCGYFHNSHNNFKTIHIAGTNGKGSTSHMIAAILQESGYKVGLYTSPHLKSFTERIRINGIEIKPGFVIDFVSQNKHFFESFDPSFFEITVAMAFEYFNTEKVDIAVIETGLGGRLDSTNIITPIMSIITNIGYDHQQLLGNSLQEIAWEKAGIIKQGVPVIIGEFQAETENVFIQKAKEKQAQITFANNEIRFESTHEIKDGESLVQVLDYKIKNNQLQIVTDQLGKYQSKNCATVWVALNKLKGLGFENISQKSIQLGFRNVTSLTGLKGRWQILEKDPWIIADTGHNIDGIQNILSQLKKYQVNQLRMIIGFVNDKSIEAILQILPRNAIYYFTQASIPRAMPVAELVDLASKFGLKGKGFSLATQALVQAKLDADRNDLIFIGGSTFVVAELV